MNVGDELAEMTVDWRRSIEAIRQMYPDAMGRQLSNEDQQTALKSIASVATLHTGRPDACWVAPDMCKLAEHAGATFPLTTVFREEELPWPVGIVKLATPLIRPLRSDLSEEAPWPLLGWWWIATPERGVLGTWLAASRAVGLLRPACPFVWHWDRPPDDNQDFPLDPIYGIMRATWTLLQQRVAVSRETGITRGARRRALAVLKVLPRCTEVTLRRPAQTSEGESVGLSVDWSHRWLVGGHWRRQWCPSVEGHRLTWVAPYVKGPADKPFVPKDRVYAWRR